MQTLDRLYSMPELKACPLETTFRIIGKKWTVSILREMYRGKRQFNALLDNIDGISPKMLSLRLKELQRHEIIRRKIASEEPIRVVYEITDRGMKLGPVLEAACEFSMGCLPAAVFSDAIPRALDGRMLG